MMAMSRRRLHFPRRAWPVWRAIFAVALFLVVVVPALDLAWNEPLLDESQDARCQLHANPAMAFQPVSPVLPCAAEFLLDVEPLGRLPLFDPYIFVPPRV